MSDLSIFGDMNEIMAALRDYESLRKRNAELAEQLEKARDTARRIIVSIDDDEAISEYLFPAIKKACKELLKEK